MDGEQLQTIGDGTVGAMLYATSRIGSSAASTVAAG